MGELFSKDYDSTLLLVGFKDYELFIIKAGDGIILISDKKKNILLKEENKEALNLTETFRKTLKYGNVIKEKISLSKEFLPLYILISTDGFSNAFSDEKGIWIFIKKISNIDDSKFSKIALKSTINFINSWPNYLKQDDITITLVKIY